MSIASVRCRNRNNSPNQLHRNHLLRPCRPPRPRRRRNRAEDRGARAPALAYREARSASLEQSRGRRRGLTKPNAAPSEVSDPEHFVGVQCRRYVESLKKVDILKDSRQALSI